jgi:uncharacterized membrane protein YphA (DoxX/SURF4 family)
MALTNHRHPTPLSVGSRLNYLRITISLAYIGGILLSPKLWFGLGRSFPRAPILSGLPASILPADILLSILLVIALILSVINCRPGRFLVAVVILTILLVLFDQMRLQPWVYQYLIMLAALACQQRAMAYLKTAEPVLLVSQLVIALLYFWSGIQKLNWSFTHEVIPDLFAQAGVHLPAAGIAYLPALGVAVALCEILIGVGLLIGRTHQTAVGVALVTHLLVLLMLVAAHRNSVVWPWNIAMMIMVILSFWGWERSLGLKELWQRTGPDFVAHLSKAVFVICGLAPALSFAGWWDLYLSAALYSGNAPLAVIQINDRARSRFPAVAQQQVFTTRSGELVLPVYEWSTADLNVPPYPEMRVYRQLTRQMCALAKDQREIELIVKGRPSVIDGSYRVDRLSCVDLQ